MIAFKSKTGLGVALAFVSLSVAMPALAQGATVGCFVSPAKLSDADVTGFLSMPASLISDHPDGGLSLASEVRALSGSSASTLDPILALVADASTAQKSAIGAGLGRAASACGKLSPDYADLMLRKVVALGDATLTEAFKAALDSVDTASLGTVNAIGGAASVSGGSGNGSTNGGGSGDDATAQTTGSFGFASGTAFSKGGSERRDVSPY